MMDFETERPRLFALAYRMLGVAADAEDVVQEAFAALVRTQPPPDSPPAWLRTVVTRLCLDRARAAAARRETYVGPWLPEPIPTPEAENPGPDERLTTLESVSIAFLLVLERLSPLERAVFLLREVFELDFADIAASIGRSEAACRQLLHRAREHVARNRPRFTPASAKHRALVEAFVRAAATGDVDALGALLAADVELVSDGGGKAQAARNVLVGVDRVSRFVAGVGPRHAAMQASIGWVNGELAVVVRDVDGRVDSVTVFSLSPEGDRIARVHVVRNPDKLRWFEQRAAFAQA